MREGPSPKLGIVVGLSAAVAVWAVLWLGAARDASALETGCARLMVGDSVELVVAHLGLEGYRPGCTRPGGAGVPGRGAPSGGGEASAVPQDPTNVCTIGNFGAQRDFPYRCEGDDCSLYWRVGGVACLVELTPGAMTVEAATFLTLEAAEG